MSELDRFREAVAAAGPPDAQPDALELCEMLWLACHLQPAGEDAAEPTAPRRPPPATVETGTAPPPAEPVPP
ncbi:hypothetical protein, partial [Actinomadura roseirufa]|uniref:hypothetical protein n=1 Tax=Actinomadura roseirufa TaxID=2094049 RepID=UPI001A9553DE